MEFNNPQGEPDVFEAVAIVATQLGLPRDFVLKLTDVDDDWSFVIKAHALMESTLTLLFVELFQQPTIRDTLAEIDTFKKLKMCTDMDLFESFERGAMRALSELRNDLVHNVDQVQFTFESYLKDPKTSKQFTDRFAKVWTDPFTIAGKTISREKFTLENPKFTIWSLLVHILGEVHIQIERVKLEKRHSTQTAEMLQRYELMMANLSRVFAEGPSFLTQGADSKPNAKAQEVIDSEKEHETKPERRD